MTKVLEMLQYLREDSRGRKCAILVPSFRKGHIRTAEKPEKGSRAEQRCCFCMRNH